jgi:hypothetical protein
LPIVTIPLFIIFATFCMIKKTLLIFALPLLALAACKHSIKPEALYGDWKYIKIDHPKGDDMTDTISTDTLKANAPYIRFTKQNDLFINWGGKILSHGKFTIAGDNINYTEQLHDGHTRSFPFWVSKLDAQTIVFETVDKNGSRVTAVKN